ncbi:hypothetical protein ZWY2020_054714 [Hordeum vulgare]|nr:hypothetical protein ZWY2020_054714 [Hordeum vulgare]
MEMVLAEKEQREAELEKKIEESKQKEAFLEGELANIWTLVAELRKAEGNCQDDSVPSTPRRCYECVASKICPGDDLFSFYYEMEHYISLQYCFPMRYGFAVAALWKNPSSQVKLPHHTAFNFHTRYHLFSYHIYASPFSTNTSASYSSASKNQEHIRLFIQRPREASIGGSFSPGPSSSALADTDDRWRAAATATHLLLLPVPARGRIAYYYAQQPARAAAQARARRCTSSCCSRRSSSSPPPRCTRGARRQWNRAQQLRPLLVLSPLLLIVAAQLWVAASGNHGGRGGGALAYLLSQVAPGDQYHRSGRGAAYGRWDGGSSSSSPWGVALALALVLILVSYQSSFQEWRLFPLRGR